MEVALGHDTRERREEGHKVSILVFVEVALGRPETGMVLSSGMGFNPCFRGSRPRTLQQGIQAFGLFKFQSLFSWKSPSDRSLLCDCKWGDDVSILVFVEVALGRRLNSALRDLGMCFNPCFRGSRPRTSLCAALINYLYDVSILVFVEVALGPAYFTFHS